MGEHMDKIKGRVKETVGTATGNDEMRREGKRDQLSGDVKGKVDDVSDKAKDATDSIGEKMRRD